MVIFAGWKFHKKKFQEIWRGGYFNDKTAISLINSYGFYFARRGEGGIFAQKATSRKQETNKLPVRENSMFTVKI